ncbi:MAG TPA: SDR family NAD(P)-dependent oxidoreductase [Actinomycetota bacterium]|nr:SDR family NAD(P)-dependent oxidoreductase [Actinomycetota bacterium]
MGKLEGRVALVTGGTSGIGRATALLFAGEGASVTITGRDEARGAEVVRTIDEAGGDALFVRADVRLATDCDRSVAGTVEAFGRLDVLFNNAGVYVENDVLGCDEDEWDLQVDTSLKGAYLMSRAALPHLIERGKGAIVNCASGWGLVGGQKGAAYCAAKGGLVLLTKAMALDHGPQGIRVNAVCPGDTETPMEHVDAERKGVTWDEYVAWASEGRALGRMGKPEEVARAVLFLASDDSSYVTGAALPVDGGGVAD